jgi:hypothetical protein
MEPEGLGLQLYIIKRALNGTNDFTVRRLENG